MYNLIAENIERGSVMKQLFGRLSPATIKTAVFGAALVAAAVIASAVLHFGAGKSFDYFSAKAASEMLLTLSRPAGVAVCVVVYLTERRFRNRNF